MWTVNRAFTYQFPKRYSQVTERRNAPLDDDDGLSCKYFFYISLQCLILKLDSSEKRCALLEVRNGLDKKITLGEVVGRNDHE